MFLKPPVGFQAVGVRKIEAQENDIRVMLVEMPDCRLQSIKIAHLVTNAVAAIEQIGKDLGVAEIVVHQQNVKRLEHNPLPLLQQVKC